MFENLNHTHIFIALSLIFSVMCYTTYLLSIFRGHAKPHVFSWFNWGTVIAIGAFAQFKVDGGYSAWFLVLMSSTCYSITLLSFKYGEKNITKSDKITFFSALCLISLWQMTHNPLAVLLCVMLIDLLSFYPTIRKSWIKPYSEPLISYFLAGFRYFFVVFTIEDITFDKAVYIVFLLALDWGFMFLLMWRRRRLLCPQGV